MVLGGLGYCIEIEIGIAVGNWSGNGRMIILVYPVHGMFLGCLKGCSTDDQLIPIDTREDRYSNLLVP